MNEQHMPHLDATQEQRLKKISRMYGQSLIAVFDECVIANLTEDYYVNCKADTVWTKMPHQGCFSAENPYYAQKMLHPDDRESFLTLFSRENILAQFAAGKTKFTHRLWCLTKTGEYHMSQFTAAQIDQQEDGHCWCMLVIRDIQEEYLAEQQKNLEISQLATAVRSAYQMVISINLTKNIYHILQYDRYPIPKPADTGNVLDLIAFDAATVHPDYQEEFWRKFSHKSLVNAFSNGERLVMMEVPHLGEDGKYHWHLTQVVQIDSPYTQDMMEITLSRNIDDERRLQEETLEKERQAKLLLEEALQKAEKASKAKSDFLSKMSHDIRTPLNAILGMTELAQMHIGDEEKMQDYLSKIAGSGAHLLALINEVLDVSKIESGTIKLEEREFNLNTLVKDILAIMRVSLESRRQTLTVHVDEGLHAQVRGDATRLQQVLVNLLSNASKYTPEDGAIFFALEELKKEEQQVGTYRFTIADNGIGMKPEYLQHIFEPFSRADDSRTSKVTGTGLGMTIVKNLVSMMNGNIEVESVFQKGSRFMVTLCLTKCQTSDSLFPEDSRPKSTAFPGVRVLLVEDNALNRQIATEMLELLGVTVEIAENGQQAVQAILDHSAAYFDMVFMDIQMPVLNGYDATRQIRHSGIPDIDRLPILAMTADAFTEDAKSARLAGMNGHLAKPISIEQLKNALSSHLSPKKC